MAWFAVTPAPTCGVSGLKTIHLVKFGDILSTKLGFEKSEYVVISSGRKCIVRWAKSNRAYLSTFWGRCLTLGDHRYWRPFRGVVQLARLLQQACAGILAVYAVHSFHVRVFSTFDNANKSNNDHTFFLKPSLFPLNIRTIHHGQSLLGPVYKWQSGLHALLTNWGFAWSVKSLFVLVFIGPFLRRNLATCSCPVTFSASK